MRYPTPATVEMTHGSPSRLRSAETVMRTALVKGSACSSHAQGQELFGTHHAAVGLDQNLEHGELLAGESHVTPLPIDLATERVQA